MSFSTSVGPNGLLFLSNTTSPNTFTNVSFLVYGPNGFTQQPTYISPSSGTIILPANGIYTITMHLMSLNCNSGSSTLTQTVNVTTVGSPCNLVASFNHTVGANGVVSFVNASTGTVANTVYFWNFGDGTTGFGASPNHTYPSAGSYFVLMTAINNSLNCMSTASMAINVTGINCVANANFSIAPTNTPQYWTATPAFPWNISNAVWSWGDGSSSNGLYSAHTYSAAGMYSICLTVTANCGATASTCATYSISKVSASSAMIQINVVPPALIETALADEALILEDIRLYPNPGSGLFYLESKHLSGELRMSVFDLQGKDVSNGLLNAMDNGTYQADLQHLNKGIYIMVLQQGKARLHKKLIITKD